MAKREDVPATPPKHARDSGKEQRLIERRANRGDGQAADWGQCNGKALAYAIGAVTKHGFAVLLGYTAEQGAYTVRVIGIEGMRPDYIRPTEDIDAYLQQLGEDFNAL